MVYVLRKYMKEYPENRYYKVFWIFYLLLWFVFFLLIRSTIIVVGWNMMFLTYAGGLIFLGITALFVYFYLQKKK